MGGRGAIRFSTAWTKKDLQSRISALDVQISAIDAKAQSAYDSSYKESLDFHLENGTWGGQTAEEVAKNDALEAKHEVWENSNRGELVTQRKKLRSQLAPLASGQRTLFG